MEDCGQCTTINLPTCQAGAFPPLLIQTPFLTASPPRVRKGLSDITSEICDADDGYAEAGMDAVHNSTMLWGTYRPHLFFGTRTRSTTPVYFGLMLVPPRCTPRHITVCSRTEIPGGTSRRTRTKCGTTLADRRE